MKMFYIRKLLKDKYGLLHTKEFPLISQMGRKAGETEKSGHPAQENPNNLQTNWADRKRIRQGAPTMQPMTNHTLLQTQRRNQEPLIPISLCFHQAHWKTVPSFSFVVIHRRWASNYQLLPQLKQRRICSVPSVCFGVKNFSTWWN